MRWQPTAGVAMLELRARTLATVRAHFAAHAALEVETPTLSVAGSTDPALTSLTTRVHALGDTRCYLHTSPEFAMKRLLAAGSGDIYQICRVYRDGELGRWHQPEFTLLEWYRIGWDEHQLMDEVAQLFGRVLALTRRTLQSLRLTYRGAFEQFAGVAPDAPLERLAAVLTTRDVAVPRDIDRTALLDLIVGTIVVAGLPRDTLVFIHDYPADQAALARVDARRGTAARFEAFIDGVELANGFAELTDPVEQRRRFVAERAARAEAGLPAPPIDEALLAALDHGLPSCAGVAVGLDRLIAVTSGAAELDSVVTFAHRLPSG